MQNFRKNVNGITLMALVVTIIILLILAGISIGMLSGDNSIINQAGNAKTQTDIAEEKEIIDLAVVRAMGKSKYGDIDETYFTNELEKNNATVTKSGSKYKVTFSSGRQYTVDSDGNVKEKNPNALEISELNENASTYFGYDVINYAQTLPLNLQDTEWQLFYAGALDGETEERIYLISKGFAKNTVLPAKDGATPIATDGVDYNAKFGSGSSGIMPKYTGSVDVATNMQKYNKDYFKDYTSTNNNMKPVAYMLDTAVWSSFANSSEGYAEWAIGGTTVELLFTAYNKYKGTSFEADAVSALGYQVRKTSSDSFENKISSAIAADTSTVDNPYSIYNQSSQSSYFWLASPSNAGTGRVMRVGSNGEVSADGYSNPGNGFRPLVLLDKNYTLEKTKDKNGNDAFKIVEQ